MTRHLSTHSSEEDDETAKIGKPRRKKNTKDWCKGKKGREHVPGPPEINHNFESFAGRRGCRWLSDYGWTGWPRDKDRWSCNHSIKCITCGKYLEWVLEDETQCPDWKGPK